MLIDAQPSKDFCENTMALKVKGMGNHLCITSHIEGTSTQQLPILIWPLDSAPTVLALADGSMSFNPD
jgi:hypothetical protein